MFPNADALCSELNWTRYRLLMRIQDGKECAFYLEECAKSGWSSRQLERQSHTLFYQRLLASQDIAELREDVLLSD